MEAEVFRPTLPDGVEKWHLRTCRRVSPRNSTRFVQVTSRTCERQVLQIGAPALALWDDMLDMKSSTLKGFVHPAVLAAPLSAGANCAAEFFG